MKKKLISLLLVLALVVGICPAAFAMESEVVNDDVMVETTVYSEFELYQRVISHSDEELMGLGYSQSEIDEVRNFSFEEAFLERAKLDYDQLQGLGYTDEQIRILKAYNGEPITPTSEILRAAAQCTGKMTGISASTTIIYYGYSWEWSTMPLHDLGDVAALAWIAVDTQGHFVSVSPIARSGYLNYYSTATNKLHTQTPLTVTLNSDYNGVSANIALKKIIPEEADGTMVIWAKQGVVNVKLQLDAASGANSLYMIKSYGAVGHKVLSCDVGFSVSAGVTGTGEVISVGVSVAITFTPTNKVDRVGVAYYAFYADGRVVKQ